MVGASLAGLRAAEAMRAEGYDGRLTIVGDELHPPYDRPPLSKELLAGLWEPDRLALTPADADELVAEWQLGRRAVGLDLAARTVALDDGRHLPFDGLVIATGARARTLPGRPDAVALPGVHVLRTLDDCLALRAAFDAGPSRVVVVGAGFIGAEVAATARGRGLDVTLVEALPVPLARVLGDEIGAVCADIHRDHGVDVRLATGVERFDGAGRVERVVLADGSVIDADVVVVGVGVTPNSDWLVASGLPVGDGVLCDATCSVAPGVVAAGDVARWPNETFGEEMRVEHWDNAQSQGAHAARRLLHGPSAGPYAPVPWFWSDQYDRKLQLSGRAGGDAEVRVVDGSLAERRFVALYGRAGRLVGVLGMNRPRPVMEYARLIADGASWERALQVAADR